MLLRLLALSAPLVLAGCGASDGGVAAQTAHYDIAPAIAIARLRAADIDGFRNARQCGFLIHFNASETGGNAITWSVTSSGKRMLQFTVRLAPSGSGTSATIEVPPDPRGKGEMYDGTQDYSHPAILQPLRPAVRELIDAAMQQRAFDWHNIPDEQLNQGPSGSICSSTKTNLSAGIVYDVRDPVGMSHEDAEKMRAQGQPIRVIDGQTGKVIHDDNDPIVPVNPWAK
jgi:hypothetical protein